MAGRGRGRGKSLLNSDIASCLVGGLTTKKTTEEKTSDSTVDNNKTTVSEAPTKPEVPSPGASPSKKQESPTLSEEDIQTILTDTRTYSDQSDIKKVKLLVHNFVREEKDVKSVACAIYQKCMEDSSLAKRGAEICDSLTSVEVGSVKFRNCLLSLVQADYKIRLDIKSSSPAHYNGFLAFLCEIFNVMRTANGDVFRPLVTPILDCFSLVLGGSGATGATEEGDGGLEENKEVCDLDDDACDIFALHLQDIGRMLEEVEQDKMKSLMNRVRTCIIHSKCSPRARCCLLEALEASARSWEPAPNDTTKYYCDMAVDIISGLVL